MNSSAQRYLPPTIVFSAALYFGWPPAQPLDLGDDLVRATSVRWRADDLAAPPMTAVASNPFLPVLVAPVEMVVEPETGKLVVATAPAGPPAASLQAGLRLEGIANLGGQRWAVLNGRARLQGDVVRTSDAHGHECEIVSINSSHIVVRCQETFAEIRLQPAGGLKPVKAAPVTKQPLTPTVTNAAPPTPLDAIPSIETLPPA